MLTRLIKRLLNHKTNRDDDQSFHRHFDRLTWNDLSDTDVLPDERHSEGYCVFNERLYIYGGRGKTGRMNDLWQFDCEEHKWSCLSKCDARNGPIIRSGCLLQHDGHNSLFVGFGFDTQPTAHCDMYRFDLTTHEWSGPLVSAENRSPPARINFSSWLYDECIWIFGGSPDGYTCYEDIWKFNTMTYKWTKIKTEGYGPPGCQWCSCKLWKQSKVIFFGGHLSDGMNANTFHMLDLVTLKWDNLMKPWKPITQEKDITWDTLMRSSPACVMWGDNTLVIWGGWNGKEHKEDMWMCDLNTLEWNPIRPIDTNCKPVGKCSSSSFMYGNVMYLFGGWDGWKQTNAFHSISFGLPSLQQLCLSVIQNHPNKFKRHHDVITMLSR